jgi:CRISPR-associated protein Cmr5
VASPVSPPSPRLLRDQDRAALAYECVEEVRKSATDVKAYKNLVLSIGVDIRRMGLSAALAAVERDKDGKRLLKHLQRAPMHTLPDGDLAAWVRRQSLTSYMLVTRELLQFVVWLRRAAQAQIKES